MPAVYAHRRFGEDVISYLPPSFAENLNKYLDTFLLGTQGPDILFYHKPLKKNPVRQKGVAMHHTAAEPFFRAQGVRLFKNRLLGVKNGEFFPNSPDAAYIAGFICHFLLDITEHPDIYELEATGVSHGRIESEFDKFLLRKDGKPTRGYNTTTPFANEEITAKACAAALEVTEEQAARAMRTIKKINGWFCSRNELFHGLAHIVLKIVKMDHKFGGMFLHRKDEPHCQALSETLEQKRVDTAKKAADIIVEYFQTIPTLEQGDRLNEIFRYAYTGGMI